MSRNNLIVILVLVLVSCAPLFSKGLYTSPDGENHLVRIAYFSRELGRGNFIPGWIDDLNKNQGYPIFFFNYPLPYYLASFWRLLGSSIIASLKFTLFFVTLLGTLGCYLWVKQVTSKSTAALIAAILFLFTPYHFLDLFVRLALGELVFLSLIPWCLYFVERKKFVLTSIAMGLLVLSHLQLTLLFLPVIILYSALRKVEVNKIIISMLAGFGLSCFYWLPAFGLLPLTKFSTIHQFVPQDHLPTLGQIIYSPWGFGFSHPGVGDELSFQMGIVNWLIVFGCVGIGIYKRDKTIIGLLSVLVIVILIMTSSPFGFWKISLFQGIQFPWRLLSIPLVITPLLAGLLTSYLKFYRKEIIALIILLMVYTNRNHIRTNMPSFENVQDSYFLQTNTTTTATPDELMPWNMTSERKQVFTTSPLVASSKMISLVFFVGIVSLLLLKWQYGFHNYYRQK